MICDHMGWCPGGKKLYIDGDLLEWKRYVYDDFTQIVELSPLKAKTPDYPSQP